MIRPAARFDRILRAADERDDRVEMIERDPQAFEDVRARFGLAQLELDPPADDLAPELDEVLDDLEQAEHARPAADDRQQRDAVAHLQLRVLVEVVQDDVGQLAALELDDDPHAVAARIRRAGRRCLRCCLSRTSSAISSISVALFT